MSRTSVPKRLGIYQQPKNFWVFSVMQSSLVIVTAYLIAIFTYLVVLHISELPHGPLWDESFRSPLAFVLIVIAAIALMIPYFQKEWDRGTRMFSILSALFLLAFSSLSTTHLVDPTLPLVLLSHYVMEPLRRFLQF